LTLGLAVGLFEEGEEAAPVGEVGSLGREGEDVAIADLAEAVLAVVAVDDHPDFVLLRREGATEEGLGWMMKMFCSTKAISSAFSFRERLIL
jgi:hypothetical protein